MKSSVLLNKPIYVGMCILDLSKLSIIMCLCKSTAIGRSCFSQDMGENRRGHFLQCDDNAKVIGKFKDETHGVPPLEFVGLRSKMYSLLLPDTKEKKTAKGVEIVRGQAYSPCSL